jgi:hypothetical protein
MESGPRVTFAGMITMGACWCFVIGVCAFLVHKTLKTPRPKDEESSETKT